VPTHDLPLHKALLESAFLLGSANNCHASGRPGSVNWRSSFADSCVVDEVSVGADADFPGPAVRTAGEAGDASLAAALAGDWVEDEIFEVYSFGGRPKLDLRAVAVVATGEVQGAKDEGRERKQDS
jgi:hypothetical protein